MGCVSSKRFRRGLDRASWYSPMVRNASASRTRRFTGERDADLEHDVSLTSSTYGELYAETPCSQGSFLDMSSNIKHAKLLSPEDSFSFTSKCDLDCMLIHDGTQPIIQFEESKHTRMSNNGGMQSVRVRKSGELEDERQHFLMCDYLHIQHGSLWEGEIKGRLMWDDRDVKNERNCASVESLTEKSGCERGVIKFENFDENHAGASSGVDAADLLDFNDERKSLVTSNGSRQHVTEVINMQELMEGLEDNARSPSSLSSGVCGMLSIPDREISFPGLMSAPGAADFGSPVWKKYYMPDNGVTGINTWNGQSPAVGSPFNESPRRALSQSSFVEMDDSRSVSSIEVTDANAIGLKILLSPANSSFHPSPVNKAQSVVSSVDGIVHGSYFTNTVCGSPYRSRNTSMDGMCGFIEHEHDMKSLYKSPPKTTSSSTRRPSMESVYESGSPLFDPSLMATFEEALKTSIGVSAYDNWICFSTDESATLSSSSAYTWESFNTSRDAENTPSEQTTEKQPTIPLCKCEVRRKTSLASYEIRCPPRGEGKVVLYFTSLRGVRKTYEDCCNIRLILRGLGVQVDERDVWMHSEFKSELNDVLGGLFKGMPLVPQVFIKGRYIGGAEVVRQLHEEGVLSCLMDGLAMGLIHSVCSGCGDARFIPCLTCNGSHKVLNVVNEVTQCLACNENGLIMCPICNR